jgi:hypothetical protein
MKNELVYQISIPQPCHENWEAMTKHEHGRHCNSCDKIVVDFASMSDEQVLNYLNQAKGRICGRVHDKQLTQSYQFKIPKKLKVFLYSIAVAFLLNVPMDSFGQHVNDTTHSQQNLYGEITGKVTDSKGEPLDFANVTAFNGGIAKGGSKTDFNGNYKINNLVDGIYTIRVSYAGYQTQEIMGVPITNREVKKVDFELERTSSKFGVTTRLIILTHPRLFDPAESNRKVIDKNEIKRLAY